MSFPTMFHQPSSQESVDNNNDAIVTTKSKEAEECFASISSLIYKRMLIQQDDVSIQQIKNEITQLIEDIHTWEAVFQIVKDHERNDKPKRRSSTNPFPNFQHQVVNIFVTFLNSHSMLTLKQSKQYFLERVHELSLHQVIMSSKIKDSRKRKYASGSSPVKERDPSKHVHTVITIPTEITSTNSPPSDAIDTTPVKPACAKKLIDIYDQLKLPSTQNDVVLQPEQTSATSVVPSVVTTSVTSTSVISTEEQEDQPRKKSKFIRFQHDFGKDFLDWIHPLLAPKVKYSCISSKDETEQEYFRPIYIVGQKLTAKATERETVSKVFIKSYEEIFQQKLSEKRSNLINMSIRSMVASLVYYELKKLPHDIEYILQSQEEKNKFKLTLLESFSSETEAEKSVQDTVQDTTVVYTSDQE